MAVATEARFNQVQEIIKNLLNKPVTKMTKRELSILPTILTFGDCVSKKLHDSKIERRDLISNQSAQSFDHLCDMICVVGDFNEFNSTTVCEVLAKHKDIINFDETSFGRDYSPVMFLSLNFSYGAEAAFMEKVNALGKDLIEVGMCDELHWCLLNTSNGEFKSGEKFTTWCPVFGDDGKTITGYEEKTFDHFRKFRVWWD
jgi:hypothetical protein